MAETPMMRQYREIKEHHPEEILFFRLGDFYEMFRDDAKEASQILNLTLTARNGTPMCGIPYHAAKNYVKRLLEAGKKIAICEQVRLPEGGKGIAEREVTQIITPGTVVDDDLLTASANNYILSIFVAENTISLSYCDISTGELCLSLVGREKNYEALRLEIAKLHPVEILLQESVYFEDDHFRKTVDQEWTMITRFPDWHFSAEDARNALLTHFGTSTLKQFGIDASGDMLTSSGVLFTYLKHNAKQSLVHIHSIKKQLPEQMVIIDEASQKNLELVRNMHDNTEAFTLFSTVRHTKTASGTRLLRNWILSPLNDIEAIDRRLRNVDLFYHDQELHNGVRSRLSSVLDLERLAARLSLHKAAPRDLLSIMHTIRAAFEVSALHEELAEMISSRLEPVLIERLAALAESIGEMLNEEVNGPFSEGAVIRSGCSAELDELRGLKDNSVGYLDAYAERILAETGIPKIRVKYNKIIGYFIEISKIHSDKVPDYFLRKQTLVNGERYTTEELISLERKIGEAYSRAEVLERSLYDEILQKAVEEIEPLLLLSSAVSEIDCYQSLAYAAIRYGYTKPVFTGDKRLTIVNGRHPVVEKNLPPGEFIPNSLDFSPGTGSVALITGPNMSGKSTFLRQTALIVLLAHMGSYVPADSAALSVHDRIFCRVGATDNLARGESTFLVEMTETAYILRNATRNSLIIMDEVGRGTSTQDGVAIAFAVLKKILAIASETLFATHYHELTLYRNVQLQHLYLEVLENEGEIIFCNKIRHGNSPSSYGLHAAKLAGLPPAVLRNAEKYQRVHAKHEEADSKELGLQGELTDLFLSAEETAEVVDTEEYDLLKKVSEKLNASDPDSLSPREALALLYELKSILKK